MSPVAADSSGKKQMQKEETKNIKFNPQKERLYLEAQKDLVKMSKNSEEEEEEKEEENSYS